MTMFGSFAPTNYDFLRSRVISPAPKLSTLTPVAPPRMPTSTVTNPISLTTLSQARPVSGAIITETTTLTSGTSVGDAPPQGPAVQPATTGASTADQSTPGSTGTSDLSRLLDLFGGTFAPKELTPTLAPTSVVETGTSDGAVSGGGNSAIIIVIVLALLGGVWWYMKHRTGAA